MAKKRKKTFADIESHDRVTLLVSSTPGGPSVRVCGFAVMRNSVGWVVNIGGKFGKPKIVSEENFVGFGNLCNQE